MRSFKIGKPSAFMLAYNTAQDIELTKLKGEVLGLFTHPMAENTAGWSYPYAPDDFKYQNTAEEIKA